MAALQGLCARDRAGLQWYLLLASMMICAEHAAAEDPAAAGSAETHCVPAYC
jgi:hypothetical protein